MSEFKGTRGEVFEQQRMIQTKDEFICDIICLDGKLQANANLIVDAFKVRQQINCELLELLEQRNEMLAMLEKLANLKYAKDLYGKNDYYLEVMPKTWKETEQLIKKVNK